MRGSFVVFRARSEGIPSGRPLVSGPKEVFSRGFRASIAGAIAGRRGFHLSTGKLGEVLRSLRKLRAAARRHLRLHPRPLNSTLSVSLA